jgi:foldase protein PrsA
MKLCRRFYSMRTRRIILLTSLAAIAATVLVACGTASKPQVPNGDVAVVGNVPISQSEFDFYWAQARLSYKKQKKNFPAVGSDSYEKLRNDLVAYLVRRAAVEQEAADMGIEVTDGDVQNSLDEAIKTNFKGSKAKYEATLKKEHFTDQAVRDEIRSNLISNQIYQQILQKVTVSQKQISDYYKAHKSAYKVDESREASHILVKTKAKAESIYRQLQAGGDFAELAKKYSTDTGTKASGGDLGVTQKKSVVKAFADVLFELETGAYSKPVHTQFGWHIVKATGPIKPSHYQSLKEASSAIQQTLTSTAQNDAVTAWNKQTDEYIADHTSYANGYAPPSTTSSSAVGTSTTQ